ncbi:MAG TPA: ribosome maturation factor RimM [Candidatus Acidoferrales bacterium]|nr:ribosome maturation factor RimM [Candidatus Acidoferrales bacterium]
MRSSNSGPAEKFSGVTLARILRPRGLRGEVAAEILTDFPERLPKLREVWLYDGRNEPRRVVLQRCWLTPSRGGQAIFHFADIHSIEDAEKLRGLEIQVPIEQRAKLSAGNYFVNDLVGCEVWEKGGAAALGSVRGVEFTGGAAPLLAVDTKDGEVLLPLAEEFCVRIDVKEKRIDVSLPEGLLDLNRR